MALEVNSNARVKDAFKYMKDRMLEMYSVREKFDEVDKRLMQLYKGILIHSFTCFYPFASRV